MKKLIAILTALVTLTACGSVKEEKELSSETIVPTETTNTSLTDIKENMAASQEVITESVTDTTADTEESSTTILQETTAEDTAETATVPIEVTTVDSEEDEYDIAWEVSAKGMEAIKNKDIEGYMEYTDLSPIIDFLLETDADIEAEEGFDKESFIKEFADEMSDEEADKIELVSMEHAPEDVERLNILAETLKTTEEYENVDLLLVTVTDAYKLVFNESVVNEVDEDMNTMSGDGEIYTVKINGKWYMGIYTSLMVAMTEAFGTGFEGIDEFEADDPQLQKN